MFNKIKHQNKTQQKAFDTTKKYRIMHFFTRGELAQSVRAEES